MSSYVIKAMDNAESISSYLSALPTICVHPELDGRTLDIVHSLINMYYHLTLGQVAQKKD